MRLIEVAVTFEEDMVGYSHGQKDMSLKAKIGSQIVGKLDYSEYEGTPAVKMVEIIPRFRRQGIGTQLLKKLQAMYPKKEIDLGMLTDDGAALMKTINRQFTPNKEHQKAKKRFDAVKSEINRIMADVEKGDRSEVGKLNDLHDESYELEDMLRNMPEGTWIIK